MDGGGEIDLWKVVGVFFFLCVAVARYRSLVGFC